MIKLKKITKVYENKDNKVVGLTNISLDFPNHGFIFIIGKSGCGKSTLLNIIGGLDASTSGQIYLNGQDMSTYNNKGFEKYWRKDIGFVFQDNNLISNLSIYENLNIAIVDKNNKDNINKIYDILEQVELNIKDISIRKPNELSGGQQQRVAIARALVKDPKIILADEPSGNLDSETGNSIFKLLKEISKNKLVIVVSHDKEAASLYGDRIIELKDGSIISDNIINEIPVDKKHNEPNNDKVDLRLPNKVAFSLGMLNIRKKLFRTIFSSFILTLTLFVTTFAIMMSLYTTPKGLNLTIQNIGDIDYLYFYDSEVNSIGAIEQTRRLIDRNTLILINENKKYEIGYNGKENIDYKIGIISNINELMRFGLDFYEGYQEITDNSIIVSDLYIDTLYNFSKEGTMTYFIKEGDNEIILDKDVLSYIDLIGKEINSYYYSYNNEKNYMNPFKISGIYKTDYHDYFDSNYLLKEDLELNVKLKWNLMLDHVFLTYMTKTCWLNSFKKDYNVQISTNELNIAKYDINFNINNKKGIKSDQIIFRTAGALILDDYYNQQILTNNSKLPSDYIIDDNEIIINVNMYNIIFDKNKKDTDFLDRENVVDYPDHIGEELTFTMYDESLQNTIISKKLKIIGVFINKFSDFGYPQVYFSSQSIIEIKDGTMDRISSIALYKNNNDKDLYKTFKDYSELGLYPVFKNSEYFYMHELGVKQAKSSMIIIGSVLTVITLLSMANLILIGISSSKKDIGIMKAIGITNKDIYKIFLFESLGIGVICGIISICFIPLNIYILNIGYISDKNMDLKYFAFEPITILIIFIASIIIPLISTLISIKRISSLKPIETIRKTF